MSESFNVSGQGSTPIEGIETVNPVTITPQAAPKGLSTQSTQAPSQQEQVEETIDASHPVLVPYTMMHFFDGIDVSSDHVFDLSYSKLVLDMLQKWNDS